MTRSYDVSIEGAALQNSKYYTCKGTAVTPQQQGRKNFYLEMKLDSCLVNADEWSRASGRVRIYMPFKKRVIAGEKLKARFKSYLPAGSFKTFLETRGVGRSGWIQYPSQLTSIDDKASYIVRLRSKLSSLISQSGDADSIALSKAILLGDRSDISQSTRDAFSRAGVAHLIAISGLHVGLMIAFLVILMRAFVINFPSLYLVVPRQILEGAVAIPLMWLYLALAGFPISGIRAALMLSVYLLGTILWRKKNVVDSVALAVFAILIIDPLSLFSVSFQLSVVAVISILIAMRIFLNFFQGKGIWKYFVSSLVISAAAIAGTSPITSYYFKTFSAAGLLTNIVAVPLTAFLLLPTLISGALLSFIYEPLSIHAFSLSNLFSSILISIAEFFSHQFSFAVFEVQTTLWQVFLIYFLMCVGILIITNHKKTINQIADKVLDCHPER
ncbi:ComEC/Rec2 family competence protein [Patescibacteria group bacterium]|nr:ComEC/Rec2 family competence protein [Patescibacteria group bacterium]